MHTLCAKFYLTVNIALSLFLEFGLSLSARFRFFLSFVRSFGACFFFSLLFVFVKAVLHSFPAAVLRFENSIQSPIHFYMDSFVA